MQIACSSTFLLFNFYFLNYQLTTKTKTTNGHTTIISNLLVGDRTHLIIDLLQIYSKSFLWNGDRAGKQTWIGN